MLKAIHSNWKSGLAVCLVSIPLSVSLAVASQVSPIQGIITGIWAGCIAAYFGGSNFNIIGPTGALSGIIASFVLTRGADQVSMLAVITGVLILVAYSFRFDRYLIFIPSCVIHGFTLGVACIIALNQLNFALGIVPAIKHEHLLENVWESLRSAHEWCGAAVLIFLVFFIALLLLKKIVPSIPAILFKLIMG